MSAERLAPIPECACKAFWLPADEGRAYLGSDDLREQGEVAFHCPKCAEREFSSTDADQTQAEDVMNTTATWFSQKLAPRVHHGH